MSEMSVGRAEPAKRKVRRLGEPGRSVEGGSGGSWAAHAPLQPGAWERSPEPTTRPCHRERALQGLCAETL